MITFFRLLWFGYMRLEDRPEISVDGAVEP
jgi:hypothetical protein